MYRGVRLGRIHDIEVIADWSLLIIFLLVAVSLATGLFPRWHPDWRPAMSWITALTAAVLFFASVLAHELSHALVGRRDGVMVRRITLFVFGGMAHMENEPPSWGAELRMAIAGPLLSIAIGVACLLLVSASVGPVEVRTEDEAVRYLATLGAGATILLWLGWVNLILGVFNLVPGFPLDGGRVLRAIVWGVTGDHRRATQIASKLGQAFAWLLIAFGIAMVLGTTVPFFGRGAIGGLWLILIGWFLNNAALMSYRHLLLLDSLNNVTARRLMHLVPVRLDPATSVLTVMDRYLMSSGQQVFPVERAGRFLGMVTLKDLARAERAHWDTTTLEEIMTPAQRLPALAPQQQAGDALEAMSRHGVEYLPVVESDHLLGVLSREDLMKWMTLRVGESGEHSSTLTRPSGVPRR